jgi:hypothetical protein
VPKRLVLYAHFDCFEHFRQVLCWDCGAAGGYLPRRWDSNVFGYWWRRLTARIVYEPSEEAARG